MQLELATSPGRGFFEGWAGSRPMHDDPVEGRVAHDLRNILNIISGNLALLARSIGDDSVARRHIDRAMAGVDLGTRLAGSVIDSDRGVAGRTDLLAARAAIESLVQDAAGEGISVVVRMPDSLAVAGVDRVALENVLVNLTVNARHAMGGTGALRVTFEDHRCKGRSMVRMSVSDTGCGMAREVIERIFEPHFTTKGSEGSGLGLATVKRFADACGGSIEVESSIGLGSEIRISMPSAVCGG